MIKTILIASFFLIIQVFAVSGSVIGQVLPSFPGEEIWNYEIPKVSNAVKSITETIKMRSGEQDPLKVSRITTSHFYKSGKIKQVEFLDIQSKEIRGYVSFDTLGRFKEHENISTNYWIKFSYDDKNGISKKIRKEPDVYGIKDNIIQYDLELLKPKTEERYRNKDMLIDSTVYSYNEYGDLKSKIVYNTSGYGITLSSSFTGGKERKEVIPTDTTSYNYTYNQNGKIIKKTKYRGQNIYEQYTYTQRGDTLISHKKGYNAFREMTKEFENWKIHITYLDGYKYIKKVYRNEQLLSLIHFDDDKIKEKINHTYEFTNDAHGNWTELNHYKEGELIETKFREITYWD